MRRRLFHLLLFTLIPLAAPAQESPDSAHQRTEWLRRVRGSDVHRSAQARIDAVRQMQAQAAAAPSAGEWSLLGPQPQDTVGLSSGRVTALAVDPRNALVAYAGGAEGGVWKTTDGGMSWAPLTDAEVSLSTGSIAIDPQHPDTVYVGTGEANDNGDSYGGAGILKSTDGGATWVSYPGPFVGAAISQIAICPTNSQVLLAGSNPRLYRSADGGATWTAVLGGVEVSSVVFHNADGNTAFAAMGAVYGGAGSGIYKSSDGGRTWSKLTGVASNGLPTTDLGRTILAPDPSNPTIFYAGITSVSNRDRMVGLYKTIDTGATWTALNAGYCEVQCWYNNVLRVSPRNPSLLYGGGSMLHMSADGGVTWQNVVQSSDNSSLGGNCCIHPDQHALGFSADGSMLYVGNDGGVYATVSIGTSVPRWISLNTFLALTQFYPGISLHPTDPTIIYGGTQDNGTLRYSGNLKWNYVECGDGGATAIDPLHPTTVYVFCNGGGIYKSQDNGVPGSFQQAGGISEMVPFAPYLTIDPSKPSTLYLGAERHVFQSNDGAATWNIASPDIALGNDICSIAVAPADSNVVYAGTCDGSVWVTASASLGAASTWTNRTNGLPVGNRAILHITPDPASALSAYVTLGDLGAGHIYHTADGGATWTNISGSLPNTPVSDLALDPDLPNTLYAGTDIGVFWTTDGGKHWTPLMNGLPQAAVTGLGFLHSTRTLRAATHGRSVWEMPLPLASLSLVPALTSIAPGSVMQGGAGAAVTVTGSNFTANSVVQWNGQNRPTTFLSSTQLTAAFSAADLSATGSFGVSVYTPPPGGGASASLSFTVSPRPATLPMIQSGGVVSDSQFGAFPAIAPGSWIEIYGVNLAATTRSWLASDFNGVNAPLSLDNVKVTIGGQPAFVEFVSASQINALAPSNTPTGLQPVVVTAPGGASTAYNVQVNATQPGLLAPSSLSIDGKQYAGALDGQNYAVPATPAKPGDVLTLYGVGFGAVTPPIAAGVLVSQSNALALPATVQIGGVTAKVLYFGLAPGMTGLYQLNVETPAIPDNLAAPLTFTLGGQAGTQTLYIAVQK